ncbi:SIR2 family protein [Ensifer sp. NBAIM29]|nr:SIR2 family protein [Ensifer sp. NBAIM29]
MRFYLDGPSIPDLLLERRDSGRVVFLCGAGVSFNSGMPTFLGLTQYVIGFFDPPADSQIMKAFGPWLKDGSAANVPLDQIFNLLHQEYGKDEVNALVTERLRAPATSAIVGHEHALIKRISSDEAGTPQIVTTNFDLLFEDPERADTIKLHVPPAFPDLSYGSPIAGITYLHGRLASSDAVHHSYVLSSADFGRAYLSEAWATKFIRSLLDRYTVVLVGYQAEDPPVKYLLQGLNHDGQFDRTRLYAFDRGAPEDIEAKWRDRGVTAIAYSDHQKLWETMEAWAERADDPRKWRSRIIASARRNPRELTPCQRGQVVHVLRSAPGAKLFADADQTPHPEWLCVLDAFCRSAEKSSGYGRDAETFYPFLAYGLDDDIEVISDEDRRRGVGNDHLLEWRPGDYNPNDAHRLGGRVPEGHEAIPVRLWHLIRWLGKSAQSPVLAWWAARQRGLHPRLVDQIEWHLGRDDILHERARHVWNLILEHHRDARNREWDGGWFDLKRRIAKEGWTRSVVRDFQRISRPRLEIASPLGLPRSKPPQADWDNIALGDICQSEVKFFDWHNDEFDVPDNMLAEIVTILAGQLSAASGMLSDLGVSYFTTPTFYPDREVDGKERHPKAAQMLTLFVELYDRLAKLQPNLAIAHATGWDERDRYFFRKLKLFALSKPDVFGPLEVVRVITALDQEAFWDIDVVRELLFLIVDRWAEFSSSDKERLVERILDGPDQLAHWSNEEYPTLRDEFAARYGRYLELKGCVLSTPHATRLAEIIRSLPRWNDSWATSTVTERGSQVGWVGTDEAPDAVLDLPANEIVPRAKADLRRDFGSFTERRPFTGLVKTNPRKALSALTISAREGDFPTAFWTAMINELPEDVSPRLYRTFLNRVARLPNEVVAELRHTLGGWLERNLSTALEFDNELGWQVYDHIMDGINCGGKRATESGLGAVHQGGEVVERSRRTYDHAINGPIGMCAAALFTAVPRDEPKEGSGVPDHIRARLERLFAAIGEGSDHAIAISMSRLNWIMYVDPVWARERLIPLLAFEHPASEPAWNGLLHSNRNPTPALATAIKPLLLKLYPWLEDFHWGRDISEIAVRWMAWMCIFRPGEADGLSGSEMRNVLRSISDKTRSSLIFWLGRVGQANDDGWVQLVIPFIEKVWPRERRFRTSGSVSAWIGLLDDTKDHFPSVYAAVKKFLAPIEGDSHPFYRFTRDAGDEEPITVKHPEATLDFINTVTSNTLSRPSYELPKILALIAETEPALATDRRYLRLVDLVERY